MVKPDADTVSTVPAAPPSAGPDRALDPPPPATPPPGPGRPGVAGAEVVAVEGSEVAAAEGAVAAGEADALQPAASPITAAATTHRVRLFETNRRVAFMMKLLCHG